jgi:hypothetical protein
MTKKTLQSTRKTYDAMMCSCGKNFFGQNTRVEYAFKLHRKICNSFGEAEDLVHRMNELNKANFNVNSRGLTSTNESTFVY